MKPVKPSRRKRTGSRAKNGEPEDILFTPPVHQVRFSSAIHRSAAVPPAEDGGAPLPPKGKKTTTASPGAKHRNPSSASSLQPTAKAKSLSTKSKRSTTTTSPTANYSNPSSHHHSSSSSPKDHNGSEWIERDATTRRPPTPPPPAPHSPLSFEGNSSSCSVSSPLSSTTAMSIPLPLSAAAVSGGGRPPAGKTLDPLPLQRSTASTLLDPATSSNRGGNSTRVGRLLRDARAAAQNIFRPDTPLLQGAAARPGFGAGSDQHSSSGAAAAAAAACEMIVGPGDSRKSPVPPLGSRPRGEFVPMRGVRLTPLQVVQAHNGAIVDVEPSKLVSSVTQIDPDTFLASFKRADGNVEKQSALLRQLMCWLANPSHRIWPEVLDYFMYVLRRVYQSRLAYQTALWEYRSRGGHVDHRCPPSASALGVPLPEDPSVAMVIISVMLHNTADILENPYSLMDMVSLLRSLTEEGLASWLERELVFDPLLTIVSDARTLQHPELLSNVLAIVQECTSRVSIRVPVALIARGGEGGGDAAETVGAVTAPEDDDQQESEEAAVARRIRMEAEAEATAAAAETKALTAQLVTLGVIPKVTTVARQLLRIVEEWRSSPAEKDAEEKQEQGQEQDDESTALNMEWVEELLARICLIYRNLGMHFAHHLLKLGTLDILTLTLYLMKSSRTVVEAASRAVAKLVFDEECLSTLAGNLNFMRAGLQAMMTQLHLLPSTPTRRHHYHHDDDKNNTNNAEKEKASENVRGKTTPEEENEEERLRLLLQDDPGNHLLVARLAGAMARVAEQNSDQRDMLAMHGTSLALTLLQSYVHVDAISGLHADNQQLCAPFTYAGRSPVKRSKKKQVGGLHKGSSASGGGASRRSNPHGEVGRREDEDVEDEDDNAAGGIEVIRRRRRGGSHSKSPSPTEEDNANDGDDDNKEAAADNNRATAGVVGGGIVEEDEEEEGQEVQVDHLDTVADLPLMQAIVWLVGVMAMSPHCSPDVVLYGVPALTQLLQDVELTPATRPTILYTLMAVSNLSFFFGALEDRYCPEDEDGENTMVHHDISDNIQRPAKGEEEEGVDDDRQTREENALRLAAIYEPLGLVTAGVLFSGDVEAAVEATRIISNMCYTIQGAEWMEENKCDEVLVLFMGHEDLRIVYNCAGALLNLTAGTTCRVVEDPNLLSMLLQYTARFTTRESIAEAVKEEAKWMLLERQQQQRSSFNGSIGAGQNGTFLLTEAEAEAVREVEQLAGSYAEQIAELVDRLLQNVKGLLMASSPSALEA